MTIDEQAGQGTGPEEEQPTASTSTPAAAAPSVGWRKWLAIGTGIGIEVCDELHVSVVKLRPAGARILEETTIAGFRERPAAEWGAEYAQFIKKLGAGHLAATVLLPRREIIVRQISMPGIADRDLPAAVRYQIDGLHPFTEDDVVYDWARAGKDGVVVVGIARRQLVDSYVQLFAEAGVRVANLTFSAVSIYSAARIYSTPPGSGFVSLYPSPGESGGLEVYGESPARPVFSATLDADAARAQTFANAELRLDPGTEPMPLHQVLPEPLLSPEGARALPYAAALCAGWAWPAMRANLLPVERRATNSRAVYVPTLVLGILLAIGAGALAVYGRFQERQYLDVVQSEMAKVRPAAMRVEGLDREIARTYGRTALLDSFRQRSKADMDAIGELTRILAAPAWLSSMELTRTNVTFAGEAEQAEALLKLVDQSALFAGSEFATATVRGPAGETFRIRSTREGAP